MVVKAKDLGKRCQVLEQSSSHFGKVIELQKNFFVQLKFLQSCFLIGDLHLQDIEV